MPWIKKTDVAMYAGADWSTLVQQVSNTTPEEARRIALRNPTITFFFYCRSFISLLPENGNPARQFQAGDAVFFSGKPWYGEAGQCDSYEIDHLAVAYINPQTPQELRDVASYRLKNGLPAIDIVCLFGANYASNQQPYLRAHNNQPPTTKPLNPGIQAALDDHAVPYLQEQGITVLLTVINGWAPVGWSEFTSQKDATDFASYLQTDIVNMYGLDGIDIDDEYSTGQPQSDSLAIVTTIMKNFMPDILITKALFADHQYFKANWNGHTLAENLTYGWEMSYGGGGPDVRLEPYLSLGMTKDKLALGFSANQDSTTVAQWTGEVVSEGYVGGMLFMYNEKEAASVQVMQTIVDTLTNN